MHSVTRTHLLSFEASQPYCASFSLHKSQRFFSFKTQRTVTLYRDFTDVSNEQVHRTGRPASCSPFGPSRPFQGHPSDPLAPASGWPALPQATDCQVNPPEWDKQHKARPVGNRGYRLRSEYYSDSRGHRPRSINYRERSGYRLRSEYYSDCRGHRLRSINYRE